MSNKTGNKPEEKKSGGLAEDVLRQAGKSDEEAGSMGKIDRAEDELEATLDPKFRTENSPVHQGIWNRRTPVSLFSVPSSATAGTSPAQPAIENCIRVVKGHIAAGTLFDSKGKVSDQVLADLGAQGYWGMLVDKKYGGQGASITDFMNLVTRMAAEGEATTAGLNSIHECIGAVDPVVGYGTDEQKARFLPKLASGEALSAFALTEPGAGSDLTAVKTTADPDGEDFVVNGEKLFISNVAPGRTIGLVCMIPVLDKEGKPRVGKTGAIERRHAVLIVDLPAEENENFRLVNYPIHAVKHIYNRGIIFTNFRVPAKNLLVPPVGDGLTIAYHGLNRGRVALCANAAGVMRQLLTSMVPWSQYRKTYGEPIKMRALVKRRVARIASLIVGADALRDWGSHLLDEGYRGELECVIAKIYASEALIETTRLALKTHGGRSFLGGHIIGDNLHDFFAPSIYEGENEMLAMAFFKSLIKQFGTKYMGPMLAKSSALGINLNQSPAKVTLQMATRPDKAFKMRKEILSVVGRALGIETRFSDKQKVRGLDARLQAHVDFALSQFVANGKQLYRTMLTHGLKLQDEQELMVDVLSMPIQQAVTMLVTALHAHAKGDEATKLAADLLCMDLSAQITGKAVKTNAKTYRKYLRTANKLSDLVVKGEFKQLDGCLETAILRQYDGNGRTITR
jgi:alkylation response protein AidB-like acyl-CoA dehydrogenase